MTNDPRYDSATYGGDSGTRFGGAPRTASATADAPWRINFIRVDGIEGIPPAVPGESASYDCLCQPTPVFPDHLDRWRSLRRYLRRAPAVKTWVTPSNESHYREQHSAADGAQLVYIAPLARDSDAAGTDADPPPTHDSPFEPRWAVVTGGSTERTTTPDSAAFITLNTTTIATADEFGPTERAALRAAREHNGF